MVEVFAGLIEDPQERWGEEFDVDIGYRETVVAKLQVVDVSGLMV